MQLVELERIASENNRDYVYRSLRESIIRAVLKPGDAISEPKLQQFFGVSRSPIREAISILAHEGLLEVRPQKTTRIVRIDAQYIKESAFLRCVAEREALTQLCCEDTSELADNLDILLADAKELVKANLADAKFKLSFKVDSRYHSMIFKFAGLPQMWDILRLQNIQYNRFLSLSVQEIMKDNVFIEEHQGFSNMLRNKDIEGLIKHSRMNFDRVSEYLEALIVLHPDYFIEQAGE